MKNPIPILPINLPSSRQTLYPAEVKKLLSMDDKHLRKLDEEGLLISINIAREGCRPVHRYTTASVEQFIRERNSRDNPDRRRRA